MKMLGTTPSEMWDLIRIEDAYGNTQLTISLNGRQKSIAIYMLDNKYQLRNVEFQASPDVWKVGLRQALELVNTQEAHSISGYIQRNLTLAEYARQLFTVVISNARNCFYKKQLPGQLYS